MVHMVMYALMLHFIVDVLIITTFAKFIMSGRKRRSSPEEPAPKKTKTTTDPAPINEENARQAMARIMARIAETPDANLSRNECIQLFNGLQPGLTGAIATMYRRLSMLFHPDHAKGRPTATLEFQILTKANACMQANKFDDSDDLDNSDDSDDSDDLDDSDNSDDSANSANSPNSHDSSRKSPKSTKYNTNADDFVAARDTVYDVHLRLAEIFKPVAKSIETIRQRRDLGTTTIVQDTFTIFVPPGILTGQEISRMAKMGSYDINAHDHGDLVFRAKVIQDAKVERNGSDLIVDVTLPLHKVFGPNRTFSVSLFDERIVKVLTLPRDAWHGQTIKFENEGLPVYQDPTMPAALKLNLGYGALHVRLDVRRPHTIPPKVVDLIEKYAQYR